MAFITIAKTSSAVSAVPCGPPLGDSPRSIPRALKTFHNDLFFVFISILLLPFYPFQESEETDKFLFFFFFGWVGHSLAAFHQ